MSLVFPVSRQHSQKAQVAHGAEAALLHLNVAFALTVGPLNVVLSLLLHNPHLVSQKLHFQLIALVQLFDHHLMRPTLQMFFEGLKIRYMEY